MRILAVGGGSGGHVTPAAAVLRELKKRYADAEIRFWCDPKFAAQAEGLIHQVSRDIPVEKVIAGKLRRYHSLPVWRQLLRPFSILLPNIRDMFLVVCGFVQSLVKLALWRPDIVFVKGGFVCLPVGIAAHLLKIPLVIHDSDAHPGLTNRILARFAAAIGTGAPLHYYPYPRAISHYVGTPIRQEFAPVSKEEARALKQKLRFDTKRPLVVVTGGGLGAENINDAVLKRLDVLLQTVSVALICGAAHYDKLTALTPPESPHFQLHAFISGNMQEYLGAADVVVARAGATSTLELAALAKPTILIPSPYLSGGHQLKNAAMYADYNAVEVIDERELDANPQLLVDTLTTLFATPSRLDMLGKRIHKLAKPHAAQDMATLIADVLARRVETEA